MGGGPGIGRLEGGDTGADERLGGIAGGEIAPGLFALWE